MNFEVNEQDIMNFLEEYKPIRAKLLYNEDGRSKGTGFVELRSAEHATHAISNLSNQLFQGRKLILNHAFNQVGMKTASH